jgi:hypothetical protein
LRVAAQTPFQTPFSTLQLVLRGLGDELDHLADRFGERSQWSAGGAWPGAFVTRPAHPLLALA